MIIHKLLLANNIWLAPMAGISNLPYRRLMKAYGAGLVFTEMISANGLTRGGKQTLELLASTRDERPLGVQLFGEDPALLAEAAVLAQEYADLIDINLGCPVKKVVRSGAGSALLRDPPRIAAIVAAVRRATDLPLTIKIRSGWSLQSINYLETSRLAEAEGADAVTLHPRTRCQGFSGHSDWEHLRKLKETLRIPVIGSGDIYTADDALRMLRQTGCDAVMIGRGGYGNPWLIRDLKARFDGGPTPPAPSPVDRMEVAFRHLRLHLETFGPRKTLLDMRKHLCWYSRGLAEAATYRAAINHAQSLAEIEDMTRDFYLAAVARSES
ncbi:tRNA dihydrouridine synthase DusB [Trichloromonas sp.]|uniref:tRNA dihydrouridine synthase DusB n=1 Tax=Trichloromonas sp. TaxID=3069249 RepID=UPI002A39038D|nr:tRNA dihydrouridine synthase DusB [Trichloromonas sp.]